MGAFARTNDSPQFASRRASQVGMTFGQVADWPPRDSHAPGLTPRAVLEKFATIQMLDAWFPTTDSRWLVFAHYTQPEKDHRLLLGFLDLKLPAQSPPRITAQGKLSAP
jgi:hypothetical protein